MLIRRNEFLMFLLLTSGLVFGGSPFQYKIIITTDQQLALSDVSVAPMVDAANQAVSGTVLVEDTNDLQAALAKGQVLAAQGLYATFYFFYMDGMDTVVKQLSEMGHEIAFRAASNCDMYGGSYVASLLPFIPLSWLQSELMAHQRHLQSLCKTPVQDIVVLCEACRGSLTPLMLRKSGVLTYFVNVSRGNFFIDETWTGRSLVLGRSYQGTPVGGSGTGETNWNYTYGTTSNINQIDLGLWNDFTSYPAASEGLLLAPNYVVYDYIYMHEHTSVKSLTSLGGNQYEILMEADTATNFRFARAPMTLLIKKSGVSVSDVSCQGVHGTYGTRSWGAYSTIPADAIIGGHLDIAFEGEAAMTAPEIKTFTMKIANKGSYQLSNISISLQYVSTAVESVSFSNVPLTLAPNASQAIPVSITTKILGFDDYAYGLKSLNIKVAYEENGTSRSIIRNLDINVIPLISVDVFPYADIVLRPQGKSYFYLTMNRKASWAGAGHYKARYVYPRYVQPANGTTSGHVEVEVTGPFEPVSSIIPFSFNKDGETYIPVSIKNTDGNDETVNEIHFRYFIDGLGEISPLHPPVKIQVQKDLLLEPANGQGLTLFYNYNESTGVKTSPAICVDPNYSAYPFGGTGTSVDGVFGNGLRSLEHGFRNVASFSSDSGSMVFWMRRTDPDDNKYMKMITSTAGHIMPNPNIHCTGGEVITMEINSYSANQQGQSRKIKYYMGMASGGAKVLLADQPPYDNLYHHVAVVWNIPRHMFRIYMDGNIADQADPHDNTVPWLPVPLYNPIKENYFIFNYGGSGYDKDEMAFFNRNLSVKEINDIMAYGIDRNAVRDPNNPDDTIPIDPIFLDSSTLERENVISRGNRGNNILPISPNPFNPSAIILLECADARMDKLANMEIYSITGKRITRSLIHPFAYSGSYTQYKYIWNAKDQASGIYIVKTTVNGKNLSKKIILVR